VAKSDRLEAALERLRSRPPLSTPPTLRSPRRLLGSPVTAFKRAAARLLAWYSAWLAGELHAFSENLAMALEDLRDSRTETRRKLSRLERRVGDGLVRAPPSTRTARAVRGESLTARDRSLEVERTLDYIEFENRFRGSPEEIRKRQSMYVELFSAAPRPAVDLGCGRGEFLRLLEEAGVEAYGVDQNADMVALCQENGLKAVQADALTHLTSLDSGSLGGIFSAQMVEHLEPDGVVRLFELAADCLAPGGVLVVETLNPESLSTFTNALYIDLGHLRPLHPQTLSFLAERAGFGDVEIRYSSPMPPESRLQLIPQGSPSQGSLEALVNENFKRIDDVLFGPQDFAVVARR
jgi:O-antigen chain-terminating methyltransferase